MTALDESTKFNGLYITWNGTVNGEVRRGRHWVSHAHHSRVVRLTHPLRLPISVTSGYPLVSVLPPSNPPLAAILRPVMSSVASQDTASTTSPHSRGSIHEEDWDRSESEIQPDGDLRTPRNSVLFPAGGGPDLSPRKGGRRGNRTLSELLKLYAEKGTDCQFSQEEATRIADVLGQWVRLPPFLLALRVSAEKPIQPLLLLDQLGFLTL
jgi:hypothetical protein